MQVHVYPGMKSRDLIFLQIIANNSHILRYAVSPSKPISKIGIKREYKNHTKAAIIAKQWIRASTGSLKNVEREVTRSYHPQCARYKNPFSQQHRMATLSKHKFNTAANVAANQRLSLRERTWTSHIKTIHKNTYQRLQRSTTSKCSLHHYSHVHTFKGIAQPNTVNTQLIIRRMLDHVLRECVCFCVH